jgi:hypothetical protein
MPLINSVSTSETRYNFKPTSAVFRIINVSSERCISSAIFIRDKLSLFQVGVSLFRFPPTVERRESLRILSAEENVTGVTDRGRPLSTLLSFWYMQRKALGFRRRRDF